MPYRLEDIGIEKTEEVFNKYYELIANSDAIAPEDKQKFGKSWRYFWDLL